MKKIIILFLLVFTLSGCSLFKSDSMDGITILTSNYALEYVTNYLYGDNSVVTSIYPDGVDISNYKFTNKQIRDYSKEDMFIYMGLTNDSNQALTFLNKNKNLKIIDASFGIQYKYKEDELWLNPSNILMISQNIKDGLSEYITSKNLKDEISKRYENIKVELSNLDANYKTTVQNARDKVIAVNSDSLLFLEKYNIEVISLDKNNPDYEKNLILFKENLAEETLKYFYVYENSEVDSSINNLVTDNNLEILNIKNLKNITDEERDTNATYITLMTSNLEELKKELYKNN